MASGQPTVSVQANLSTPHGYKVIKAVMSSTRGQFSCLRRIFITWEGGACKWHNTQTSTSDTLHTVSYTLPLSGSHKCDRVTYRASSSLDRPFELNYLVVYGVTSCRL